MILRSSVAGRCRTESEDERRTSEENTRSTSPPNRIWRNSKHTRRNSTKNYEKPPPGLIKEHEDKPEDCIPAEPGNEAARTFLAKAPTRGLWMPLGKEVKVMQCWRCKRYGHRTGDKECPFFIKGNQKLEQFRVAHEDPMYDIIRENKRNEKETRIQQLQKMLQDTTSSSSDSSSSSSDHHRGKKRKKQKDKKKKDRKRKGKRKHKTSDSSDSD
uniref:RP9 pre-mRNA splicing factor n=1 Tax=Gasterosteus aculeatus aculeatus TaxID=481459 RepID=A0AAQ4PLB5_GASAC